MNFEYSTGTIGIQNGGTSVTGTGTDWKSNVGNFLTVGSDGTWYEIASVNSPTSLTLKHPYAGATNASATYVMTNERKTIVKTAPTNPIPETPLTNPTSYTFPDFLKLFGDGEMFHLFRNDSNDVNYFISLLIMMKTFVMSDSPVIKALNCFVENGILTKTRAADILAGGKTS